MQRAAPPYVPAQERRRLPRWRDPGRRTATGPPNTTEEKATTASSSSAGSDAATNARASAGSTGPGGREGTGRSIESSIPLEAEAFGELLDQAAQAVALAARTSSWRRAPVRSAISATGASSASQPSACACGATASSSAESTSVAGTRHSRVGVDQLTLHPVAGGDEAVLVERLLGPHEPLGHVSLLHLQPRHRLHEGQPARPSRPPWSGRRGCAPPRCRSAAGDARPTTGRWARGTRRSGSAGLPPPPSPRSPRTRAGYPRAGTPGTAACAPSPGPVSRPCQNGEFTDSASSSGRCARIRLTSRMASSGSSTPTCTCRAKVGSRRASSRIDP